MSGKILMISLVLAGTLQLAAGQQCPAKWFGYSPTSKCYRFMTADLMSWQDARDFCKIHGGDLAKMDTVNERNWIFRVLGHIRNQSHIAATNYWTGLNSREFLSKWEWADGTPALRNVITWARGQPNNANGTERCGEIVQGNKFNDESCSDRNRYICYRDRGLPMTCDADSGWQSLNGACYKVYMSKRNWNAANQRCNHDGSSLVTIDSQNEELIMHDFAVNNKQPIWIGLYTQKTSATQFSWMWSNGTALATPTYWNGKPYVARANFNKTCASVTNARPYARAWASSVCNANRAFVCKKPEGVCLPGWIGHRKYCYQIDVQYRLNFARATRYCQSQGSELVSVYTVSDQMFLMSYITEMKDSGVQSFWIGASDNNHDAGPYKWRNGKPVSYSKWATGTNRTSNTKGKQDCVYVSTNDQNAKWRVTPTCSLNKAFICKIPMGTSVKVVSNTPRPHFGCPTNWKLHNGKCYKVGDRGMDWATAQSTCQQTAGANLATIDSANTQSFVNGLLARGQTYWIGLNDQTKDGSYMWVSDNSQLLAYKNWAHGQPNNGGHQQNCVAIISNKWDDQVCNQRKLYVCAKIANSIFPSTPVPTPAVDWTVKCGVGWESNPLSNFCYIFVDQPLSWLDALTQCHAYHGNLVSIETVEEQSYIAGRLLSMNSIAVWTGANDRGTEGGWRWSSGKPFSFLNWAQGQPGGGSGQGTDCVSMFTANAQWDDVNCNTRNGYICEKNGRVPHTHAPVTATIHVPAGMVLGCRPHWKPYGGNCYLVAGGSFTWTDAQTACGRNGGKLASVLNRAENSFIVSNLPKLAHSYYGLWVGLNDRQSESTFRWADGNAVTYTNWNVNEPNSWMNHNEDCVLMLGNGKWNDENCMAPRQGFICKAPKGPVSATQSPYQIGCPQYTQGYGPYCYKAFSGQATHWNTAIARCNRTYHGTLATVNSRYLQAFLSSQLVYRTGYFWIGMSDTVKSGTYTWLDGASIQYTNWYFTHTGNEHSTCVAMRSSTPTGLWENRNCTDNNNFICQFARHGYTPPPPTPTPYPMVDCPHGWQPNNGFCYHPFANSHNKKTWMEALTYCQGLGGDLPSFHENNNDTFLTTLLAKYKNMAFWIGLNDRDTEAGYKWTDGSPLDVTNWNPGEPNNFDKSEDCVEYSTASHGWNDNLCYQSKFFICALPRGTNLTAVTVPPTSTTNSQCGSDPNWLYYNKNCYILSPPSGSNAKLTWYDASTYCNGINASLLSVHNDAENGFIYSVLSKRSYTDNWIGFNELGIGGYQWTDGSSVAYDNWAPNEPNNYFGGEKCVSMISRGWWNDAQCGTNKGFVCKRPPGGVVNIVTPAPYPKGGCANGFTRVPGGRNKCFYLGGISQNARLNWTAARDLCRRYGNGYDIASVEDLYEQEFLLTLLKGKQNSFWIGLADMYLSNTFFWQDNAPVIYTNWDRGQPSTLHAQANAKKVRKCALIRMFKNHEGRWADADWSQHQSFVCQARQDPNLPIYTPQNGCPSGYQPYANGCYTIKSASKNWADAQTDCKKDKGDLASITDIFESAFVVTQAVNDNLFPYWIGLSDARVHGLYGWSDGWPVLFTNWGWKEPSYGQATNDNGCVLANRNGKWNDTNCSRKLHYACKITQATPPPTSGIPPGSCADPTWFHNGDYCYYIQTNQGRSWPEANYVCEKKGMKLASIHSKAEMDFVFNLASQAKVTNPQYKPNIWLGLSKGPSGTYTWSDGSAVNLLYWTPGEPTILGQHGEMQECVEFDRKLGTWNDVSCFTNRGLVCKTTLFTPTAPPVVIGPSGQPQIPYTGSDILPTYKVVTDSSGVRTGQGASLLPGITFPNKQVTGAALTGDNQKQTQTNTTGNGLSNGGIAGVVLACVAIIVLVAFGLVFLRRSGKIKAPLVNGNDSLGFDNALYNKQNESIKIETDA